jgi:phage/conjugal plasmid C-4 type zinc finger TraR family protein
MNENENLEYNNAEEAEVAQISRLIANQNAVNHVLQQLLKQAQEPSATECEQCGEEIPEERRVAVPGVKYCIFCKAKRERTMARG